MYSNLKNMFIFLKKLPIFAFVKLIQTIRSLKF